VSPLAVELLRRLSLLAIVISLVLVALPRALSEFGVIGPGVDEQLTATERALEVARAYGGGPEDPAFHAAEESLAEARRLARAGESWSARSTVRRASEQAVGAQRSALTAREAHRRQAATIATDIDQRMNDLEDLYGRVTRGPGESAAEKALLPVMKDARRIGATVLLAIDQGEYGKAIALNPEAQVKLDEARKALNAYGPAPPPTR
jgi:hypothetical protein